MFVMKTVRGKVIAIPENNAKIPALQNVNYCITDFRRTRYAFKSRSCNSRPAALPFFALFSCYKLGVFLTRKSLHASEQERPLCQGKRRNWKKHMSEKT